MKRGDFLKRAAETLAGTAAAVALPEPAKAEPVTPALPVPRSELTVTELPPANVCPHCGHRVLIQHGEQHDPDETRKLAWGQSLRFSRSLCQHCGWERVKTRRW